VTHHGSSPDRPRGRRARPETEVPEWAGHDAAPGDERAFPDLAPIRPREARGGRHAGGQAPWDAQQAQDQRYAQGQQYPQGQYAQGQDPQGRYAQGQQTMQQPPRSAQPAQDAPSQGADDWDDPDANDPMAAFSERWHRRGQEAPADHRKRKRLYLIGSGVAAVVIAVLVYFLTAGNSGPANTGIGALITSFLPGELQQVPDACGIVPSATVSQFLPGKQKVAEPPLNSGAQSECTWTLDSPPTYRVLEVYLTAYSPNALVAVGNGSATFAAEYAYAEDETGKQHPGANSGQPAATVTNLQNLGSSAFSAVQEFHENSAVTDVAAVYVRYRNVIIQVVVNGLDQGTHGGKQYGPVSQSTLLSAARTVAQQVTAKISH
jgi:hypothetical protein